MPETKIDLEVYFGKNEENIVFPLVELTKGKFVIKTRDDHVYLAKTLVEWCNKNALMTEKVYQMDLKARTESIQKTGKDALKHMAMSFMDSRLQATSNIFMLEQTHNQELMQTVAFNIDDSPQGKNQICESVLVESDAKTLGNFKSSFKKEGSDTLDSRKINMYLMGTHGIGFDTMRSDDSIGTFKSSITCESVVMDSALLKKGDG